MVEIVGLTKNYGMFRAVKNISFKIPSGAIFGFVGPNGAGKTTTLKIMAGLLKATSGGILINGVDVVKNPAIMRENIGYMPDFFGVYENLKTSEYLDFFAAANYVPRKERAEIISDLLELVGLTAKKDSFVDDLSRGMKQRLCLARSLVHDPELLILDEPASGLDPRARVEMKEILKHLKKMGKTVIISSHILSELTELCTQIGIIDNGVMVANGSLSEIRKLTKKSKIMHLKPIEMNDEIVKLLSEEPCVGEITIMTEEIVFEFSGSEVEAAKILKNLIEKGFYFSSFMQKEGSLEEIFMNLTGGEGNEGND